MKKAALIYLSLLYGFCSIGQIKINKPQIDKTVFLGNARYTIAKKREYQRSMEIFLLNAMYKKNPNLNPDDATRNLNKTRENYKKIFAAERIANPTKSDEYNIFIKAVKVVPGIAEYANIADLVATVGGYAYADITNIWNDKFGMTVQTQAEGLYNFSNLFLESSLNEGYGLAKENKRFERAFDNNFSTFFGTKILDDAKRIMANNPEFAQFDLMQEIYKKLNANGELVLENEAQLEALIKEEFKGINQTIENQTKEIKDFVRENKSVIEYVKNEELRRRAEEEAQRQAIFYQTKIDAAYAGVSILSNIATLTGRSKLATEITVIGQSAIQIATSINKFSETIAKIGALEGATALSSAVLTGNLLGAAMNIVSLFASSGPTPEQIILEQLQAMHQELRDFRLEVRDYFEKIDKRLVDIQLQIDEGFRQLAYQLETTSERVTEIQNALTVIDSKLRSYDKQTYSYLSDLYKKDLILAFNDLGYEKRFNKLMPFDLFTKSEGTFYTWAVDFTQGDILAGPTTSADYTLLSLNELENLPVETRLNFISEFVENFFGQPPLAHSRISNPTYWIISSGAYLKLLDENSTYKRNLLSTAEGRNRVRRIYNRGLEIQSALSHISISNSGTTITTNFKLFDTILTRYSSNLKVLKEETVRLENKFLESMWQNYHTAWKPVDTFVRSSLINDKNLKTPQALDREIDLISKLYITLFSKKVQLVLQSLTDTSYKVNGQQEGSTCAIAFQPGDERRTLVMRCMTESTQRGELPSYKVSEKEFSDFKGISMLEIDSLLVGEVIFNADSVLINDCFNYYSRCNGCMIPATVSNKCPLIPSVLPKEDRWNNYKAISIANIIINNKNSVYIKSNIKLRQRLLDSLSTLLESQILNIASTPGTTLNSLLLNVTALKKLVRSLIRLGLPEYYESDELLQYFLVGYEGLLDNTLFANFYASDYINKSFGKHIEGVLVFKEYLSSFFKKIKEKKLYINYPLLDNNLERLKELL